MTMINTKHKELILNAEFLIKNFNKKLDHAFLEKNSSILGFMFEIGAHNSYLRAFC